MDASAGFSMANRNLGTEFLHQSRIKHFTGARSWVLGILLSKLNEQAGSKDGDVSVMESFQFALFCLLVLMCFGKKLDGEKIRAIEHVQKSLQRSFFKSGCWM